MKPRLATGPDVQNHLERCNALVIPIGSEPGLSLEEHGACLYQAGLEDAMERWQALLDS